MDRLRWDNIARAAALLAVVALVVAWPHLKRHAPSLPSAAATPVSVEDPALPAPAPARPRPRPRPRPAKPRRPAKPPHRVTHRAPRPRPVPRKTVAPPPRPHVLAPPMPRPAPPSPDDQAAREFALP